jgi:hypothetical protein
LVSKDIWGYSNARVPLLKLKMEKIRILLINSSVEYNSPIYSNYITPRNKRVEAEKGICKIGKHHNIGNVFLNIP